MTILKYTNGDVCSAGRCTGQGVC